MYNKAKKTVPFLICFLGAVLMSPAVKAAPNINGVSGTINNPIADTLQEGQFGVAHYRFDDFSSTVVNIGLVPGVELGAARLNYDNAADKNILNAKLSLISEKVLVPGISIGVEDMTDKRERTVYAAASKSLPFGFRIHAGVGDGRIDGFFAGVEKVVKPLGIGMNGVFPTTTLMAEYDGKDMNYGARLSIVPGLKVEAGWKKHDFYTGLSFTY